MEYFIDIMTDSEVTMNWFSELPPVTYQYARYTDWVSPFLKKVVNDAGSSVLKEKATILLSKFELYEAYLLSKDGVPPVS